MKKILLVIISLFIINISMVNVQANSFSTTMQAPSSIAPGATFSVVVGVSGSPSVSSFFGALNYDKSKLQLQSNYTSHVGNGMEVGSNIVADWSGTKSGSYSIVTLRFKALAGFAVGQSTTVSVSKVSASTGSADIAGSTVSRAISVVAPKSTNNNLTALTIDSRSVPSFSANTTTYNMGTTDSARVNVGATTADSKARVTGTGTVNLAYGANTIRVVVTSESGATKAYAINITRNDPRSSNNFLQSITMSEGTLQFDKNRDSYTVIVDYDVEELTITATKEDATASLANASVTKQLDIYSNIFQFVVVAENNQQRTYTINVVRRDETGYAGSLNTNNNLASLEVEGYNIDFNKDTLSYSFKVGHTVKELAITAQVENEKATLVLPENYQLDLGENVLEFVVIAEDETQKKYTLTIFRELNLAPLAIDELIDRLDEIEADILHVKSTRNQAFDVAQLEQLKATGKKVAFHIMNDEDTSIGYWLVDSEDVLLINDFNKGASLLARIPESINDALNYANAMVVTFDHDGEFDPSKSFVLYLNNTFDSSYALNVYYFNEETGKLELVHDGLAQNSGTLTWQMDYASIYVITPATINTGFNIGLDLPFDINLPIVLGIMIALILSLFGNLLLLLRVKKIQKHLLKRREVSTISDAKLDSISKQELDSRKPKNVEENKESI